MDFDNFVEEMSKKVGSWLKRSTNAPNAVIVSKEKYEEYKKALYPRERLLTTPLNLPSEWEYLYLTTDIRLKVIPVEFNHINSIELPRLAYLDDSENEV